MKTYSKSQYVFYTLIGGIMDIYKFIVKALDIIRNLLNAIIMCLVALWLALCIPALIASFLIPGIAWIWIVVMVILVIGMHVFPEVPRKYTEEELAASRKVSLTKHGIWLKSWGPRPVIDPPSDWKVL